MRLMARLCVLLTLLAACQMQAPQKPGPEAAPVGAAAEAPSPITGEAISVTPLDGPASSAPAASAPAAAGKPTASVTVQVPDKTTPRPQPRPVAAATPPAPPPPVQTPDPQAAPKPVSPEQAICEKAGGQWAEMPTSTGRICLRRTKDAGKVCHGKRDCQGECLARSGTCSPITPLVGCNDILQADGTEVTLCLQ